MKEKKTSTTQNRKKAASAGSWKPGQSGNPGGRAKIPKEVVTACRARSMRAIERLSELMESKEGSVAVRACQAILDRAWGTPSQSVQHSGPGGDPIKISGESRLVVPEENHLAYLLALERTGQIKVLNHSDAKEEPSGS